MHPRPRRALLGTAATLPAASARRGPAIPGDVTEGHIGGPAGIRLSIMAA